MINVVVPVWFARLVIQTRKRALRFPASKITLQQPGDGCRELIWLFSTGFFLQIRHKFRVGKMSQFLSLRCVL
jgi:hypothetical protein